MDGESQEKIFLAAMVVSLFSILPLDIGFYTFTRIVISISSVVGVLALRKKDNGAWIVFALLAILYNPIIPVYLHEKELWTVVNASTALAFVWLLKNVSDDTNLIDMGLLWISRLGLLGCLAFPVVAYVALQITGEAIQTEAFIGGALAFWVGGIAGALAINKIIFGQTSIWVSKKNPRTDTSR